MTDTLADIDAFWTTPFQVCPDDRERQLAEVVRYATMAPNAHNTQPWLFEPTDDGVTIHADFTRSAPLSDPGDRELWLSIGCALENLHIAARRVGWEPSVEYFPADATSECIRVTFSDREPVIDDPYFEAIPMRQSNRRSYDGRPIPADDLKAISEAGEEPGVRAVILTGEAEQQKIIDVTDQGFAWQRSNKAFRRELISWIRFSKAEITRTRDGLTSRATGRPMIPEWFGRIFFNVLSVSGLEAKEIAGKIRSAPALLALVTERNDREGWVRAGRSLARYKLEAISRGIVNSHLNNNWQWDATREPARRALGLDGEHVQVVIRMGYAERLPYSTRRRVDDVMRAPAAS